MIYSVDDLNMAMLDPYNTAPNISLMRQHMGYGHVYDLNKLSAKVLLDTQYITAMNPTAGSFIVNPRLQRLMSTFAIHFPSLEPLNTIYATFLLGHLTKFSEEVQEVGKRLVQAALQLHKSVARIFRKTASSTFFRPRRPRARSAAVPRAARSDARRSRVPSPCADFRTRARLPRILHRFESFTFQTLPASPGAITIYLPST